VSAGETLNENGTCGLTCDLVTDKLAGLNLADAAEQATELLLGHVLGQVVDDEVGLAVVGGTAAGLHRGGAAAAVGGRPVGGVAAGAVGHRSLHVTDDLSTRRWEVGVEEGKGIGKGRGVFIRRIILWWDIKMMLL